MMRMLVVCLSFVLACGPAGATGGRPWGPQGTPYAFGFPFASFNIVVVGNSLAAESDSTYLSNGVQGYSTQLGRALTAAGVSYTMTNRGVSGADISGGTGTCNAERAGGCDLSLRAATEVDPLWDGTKNNIMIFQEWTNGLTQDCRGDFSGAGVPGDTPNAAGDSEISKFQAYVDARPNRWYVIVVMPPPATPPEAPDGGGYNTGTGSQACFESARQRVISTFDADTTLGGRVSGIYHVETDTRIGLQANAADNDFYNSPGSGADQNTHWRFKAHALATVGIYKILHTASASQFPYSFESTHAWPNGIFRIRSGADALDASGNPATNGVSVKTLVGYSLVSNEWGNLVQATVAKQPIYDSTGFGGLPAVTLVAADDMLSTVSTISVTRGSVVFVGKATASGVVLQLTKASNIDRRFYAGHTGSQDVELYEFNQGLGGHHGCILTGGNGLLGSTAHVVVWTWGGTCLSNHIYIDGTDVPLTVANDGSPYNENQSIVAETAITPRLGLASAPLGSMGTVVYSSIEYKASDVAQIDAYWCATRGVGC